MKVRMHVERLVLDGLGLDSADAELVREGLEAELSRLMIEVRLDEAWLAGGHIRALRPTGEVDPSGRPARLGWQVARTLVESIGELE